jgi:hypothetical protein
MGCGRENRVAPGSALDATVGRPDAQRPSGPGPRNRATLDEPVCSLVEDQ